jgi:hypothetical protein
LALGFRGLSPSWWGEFCKKNKRHTHREREREGGREIESNREKDTERKPSLLTGRYLPSSILFSSGSSLLDGVTHIQGSYLLNPQLMFSGNTLTDTLRSEFY